MFGRYFVAELIQNTAYGTFQLLIAKYLEEKVKFLNGFDINTGICVFDR